MKRLGIFFFCVLGLLSQASADENQHFARFLSGVGIAPPSPPQVPAAVPVALVSATQDFGSLTVNASCHTHTPLRLGNKTYECGLGTHANSRIVFHLAAPCKRFVADVGVDTNEDTKRGADKASVVFIVKGDDRELAKTPICRFAEAPRHIDVSLDGVRQLELIVTDADDGISFDQADWADARLSAADGKPLLLGEIVRDLRACPFLSQTTVPASFVYGGQPSDELLKQWPRVTRPVVETAGRRIHEITWREPSGVLAVTWHVEVFRDRPAVEFRWFFENVGKEPSKPLADVFALDLRAGDVGSPARLTHSSGGLTGPFSGEPAAFLVSESELKHAEMLAAAGGRSSNKDLPFFVLHDKASNSGVFAGIGWSGQWQADFRPDVAGHSLRVTAGMPGTNLALPPGERIASPSILLGAYRGDSQTGCNALRRTLYDHYVALLGDKKPLPPVSWNHWFTFDNRVSQQMLKRQIDAMGRIGLEYFCIDAGWFEGGFPTGVGNWTVDREVSSRPCSHRKVRARSRHEAGLMVRAG